MSPALHLLLGSAIAALLAVSAWMAWRLMVIGRRIDRLFVATRRLKEGDRSARSGVRHGNGRLPQLARAFDAMAQALEERQTELERTTEALRRQALVFDTLMEGVLITDPEGRIIDWNPGAERLFGYTREEILGKSPAVFHHPEMQGALEREILDHMVRDGRWAGEMAFVRKDGTEGVSDVVVVAQYDAEGRRVAHIGVNRDITDRKRVEAALRRSEEQYRLLFERNPHPMWVYDPRTLRFLAVNDAAIRVYGWSREEVLRMTLKDIRPPEDIPLLLEDVARSDGARGPSGPWRHRTRDGTELLVEVAGDDVVLAGRDARIVTARDVTARVRAEEALRRSEDQLRQAQKMEAVGRLAGGVAHDFNNLLTAIQGNAEMAMLDLPTSSPVRAELEQLQQAAETAASLTRQLLAFSRRDSVRPQLLDLNEVVRSTVRLLQRAVGSEFQLVTELEPASWPVRADRGQLEQVLMNLALNGRDAMPGGGRLLIGTRNVELTEEDPERLSYVAPGSYLQLTVRDGGSGMDEATRQRIFEPFFTTKELGKGTGLGLFTVYGIVRQCGGHILVESEPGEGTEFRVLLPALPSSAAAVEPERAPPPELPTGMETILLVDDEPPVRLLTLRLLQRIGYQVLEAANGEEALRVSSDHDGPIHLLLTDVTMPAMGGRELARRMAELRPDTPVVFMSGYTEENLPLGPDAPARFIHKPFTLQLLARTVRDVLDTVGA